MSVGFFFKFKQFVLKAILNAPQLYDPNYGLGPSTNSRFYIVFFICLGLRNSPIAYIFSIVSFCTLFLPYCENISFDKNQQYITQRIHINNINEYYQLNITESIKYRGLVFLCKIRLF